MAIRTYAAAISHPYGPFYNHARHYDSTVPCPECSHNINPFPPGEIFPLHLLHHFFLPFQQIPGINETLYYRLPPREYPRQSFFPAFPGQQMPLFTSCLPCPAGSKPYGRLRGKIMHGYFYDFPFFFRNRSSRIKNRFKARLPKAGSAVGGYIHSSHRKAVEGPFRACSGKSMIPLRNINQSGNLHKRMVCFPPGFLQGGMRGSVSHLYLPITL